MVKLVVLDLDGVVYLGNRIIPGADKAIEKLEKNGIDVVYLTNACRRSRRARAEKLKSLGIRADEQKIYTTSYALAKYISENYPKTKQNVFYIGGKGIEEEMRNLGINIVSAEKADIVVVGLDLRLSYDKLAAAFRAIIRGAEFIASNTDPTFPVEDGLLPGAGAIVNFLAYASRKEPKVIGKPNQYMLKMILKEFRINKKDLLIVGDRLETDILLGKRAGVKTALVLSGVSKSKDLKKLKKSQRPDYLLNSIVDLPEIILPLNRG